MKTLFLSLSAALLLTCATLAADPSSLKAPKGAKAAIIVFEDLQCPQCRRAAPQVAQAGKTYKIPVIRHDFPLPNHDWSYNAALIAHYFDQTSKDLGNAFRDYAFEHQMEINPGNLRSYADKFSVEHKASLPFVIDPQGKLAAQIAEDKGLGQRIGLDRTPTIFVISANPSVKPAEVPADMQQFYLMIDAALK